MSRFMFNYEMINKKPNKRYTTSIGISILDFYTITFII